MSLAHLNQESRNELERRVLAAALKLSLLKGDKHGAKLAHQCLSGLLKIEKKPEPQPTVGLTTTTEQVPFTDDSETAVEDADAIVPVNLDLPEILELPELPGLDGNDIIFDLSSIDSASPEVVVEVPPEETSVAAVSAPEQTSDNNNDAESAILQLQKIGEKSPKPSALNIDFELPPAEKARMNAASSKPPKAVKATSAAAKAPATPELTATTENQTIYGAEGEQMIAGIILPPFLTEPQVGLQYHALYKMLGVRQTATRDDIHKTFLRLVRRILRELKGAKRPSRQELLGYLRKVWIAHDILADPNTRTDYDFRDLGLRGTAETEPPPAPDAPSKPASTQMLLRIGELLQVAGLLETAELEIACDMHKAMPEMMFGTFLVRQGFIADSELESVLYGQKALRSGAISVAQFQVAMELSREKALSVKDALIEKGFSTQARLDELDQQVEPNSAPISLNESAPPAAPGEDTEIPVKNIQPVTINENSSLESIEERLATAQPLQISKAAPSWKDQLDWSSPAEEESPAVEPNQNNVEADTLHLPESAPDVTPELVEAKQSDEIEQTEAKPLEEAEAQPPVQPKRETTVTEHEPGLFSHMREAASFYDAEEDFFSHYNYAQPESEPAKAEDAEIEIEIEDRSGNEEVPAEPDSIEAPDNSEVSEVSEVSEISEDSETTVAAKVESDLENRQDPDIANEHEADSTEADIAQEAQDLTDDEPEKALDIESEATVEKAELAEDGFAAETDNSVEAATESENKNENESSADSEETSSEYTVTESEATVESESADQDNDNASAHERNEDNVSEPEMTDDTTSSDKARDNQPAEDAEKHSDEISDEISDENSDKFSDEKDSEHDREDEYDDRYDDYDK